MIPTYTNSSSPSFPFELNSDQVHLHHHHDHLSSDHNNNNIIMNVPHVNPYNNYQFASSSSNSSSCQTFFNMSTTNIQDQRDNYTYHSQFHHPQHQHEVDNFGSRSGSHDHVEKKNKGIKLTFWKKGEAKMKNNLKLEDQKIESTTDHSSNNSSSNNNIPIRVCSDCNTTKTPLWRSGPKGPKSLCNACGIRQRKARRAMAAAAAAAANGTNFTSSTTATSSTTTTTTMKIKVQQQQKQKITKVNTNHVVPFKKRCKFLTTTTTTGPSSSPSPAPTSAPPVRHHVGSSLLSSSSSSSSSRQMKKLSFDDFYVDLSNNLGIHRVFPQDEKEAAILLMALSSGLVHG